MIDLILSIGRAYFVKIFTIPPHSLIYYRRSILNNIDGTYNRVNKNIINIKTTGMMDIFAKIEDNNRLLPDSHQQILISLNQFNQGAQSYHFIDITNDDVANIMKK